MSRLSIPELLKNLEGKSEEEKRKLLLENDTRALRQILYLAFSKDVQINLPNERPELKLKEVPEGLGETNLFQQARKLRVFVKGTGYDHLSDLKRETIFIQILESLSSSESELLLQILIDKNLKSSLEYSDVNSSFPGLLPEIKDSSKPKKKAEPVKKSPEPVVEEVKEEKQPEPQIEEVKDESKEEPVVYKNLSEVYEKNKSEEEPAVYKNLSEVYEKNKPKQNNKKSKNKKSSKKKSK